MNANSNGQHAFNSRQNQVEMRNSNHQMRNESGSSRTDVSRNSVGPIMEGSRGRYFNSLQECTIEDVVIILENLAQSERTNIYQQLDKVKRRIEEKGRESYAQQRTHHIGNHFPTSANQTTPSTHWFSNTIPVTPSNFPSSQHQWQTFQRSNQFPRQAYHSPQQFMQHGANASGSNTQWFNNQSINGSRNNSKYSNWKSKENVNSNANQHYGKNRLGKTYPPKRLNKTIGGDAEPHRISDKVDRYPGYESWRNMDSFGNPISSRPCSCFFPVSDN